MKFKIYLIFLTLISMISYAELYDNKVEAGVYITKIYDFKLRENEVSAEFYVWYNYSKNQPVTIDYGANTTILNAKGHNPGPPLTTDIGNQMHTAITFNSILISDWNVKNFPFDRHEIKILVSPPFDEDYIQLVPDLKDSSVYKGAIPSEWEMVDFTVKEFRKGYDSNWGYHGYYTFKPYSTLEVTLTIKRSNAWNVFFKTFFQLFIAIFMALLTFFVSKRQIDAKFGLSIGAIFIVIGSQYMVGTMLPDTPTMTLTDIMHIIAYLFLFMCVAVNIATFNLSAEGKEKSADIVNKAAFYVIIVLYILINLLTVILNLI